MSERVQERDSKKPFYKKWWVWVLTVLALIIIGAVNNNGNQSMPAIADNPNGNIQQVMPDQPPVIMRSLLKISGSGTKSTQKFTVAGDWDLSWDYNCSNFGTSGNFIVMTTSDNGQVAYQFTPVNQLGQKDSGIEHYHTGGTYFLQINSECKWNVEVKG